MAAVQGWLSGTAPAGGACSLDFSGVYVETVFLLCFQMKTVSVALVLCLNVGVDPPDVVKTTPCARLECWIGKCQPLPWAPTMQTVGLDALTFIL